MTDFKLLKKDILLDAAGILWVAQNFVVAALDYGREALLDWAEKVEDNNK